METCMQLVLFGLIGFLAMIGYQPWRTYLAYRFRHDRSAEHRAFRFAIAGAVLAVCAVQFFVIEPLAGPRVSYAAVSVSS